MSYARFSNADVYVFLSVSGHLDCCGCRLRVGPGPSSPPGTEGVSRHPGVFYTTDGMLDHLRAHREAGHHVPDHVFDDLEADREENDAWIAAINASGLRAGMSVPYGRREVTPERPWGFEHYFSVVTYHPVPKRDVTGLP